MEVGSLSITSESGQQILPRVQRWGVNGGDTTETPSPLNEGPSKAPVVQRGARAWAEGAVSPQVLGLSS